MNSFPASSSSPEADSSRLECAPPTLGPTHCHLPNLIKLTKSRGAKAKHHRIEAMAAAAASSLSKLLSSLLLPSKSPPPPPPPELSLQPRVPRSLTSGWAPLVANWSSSPSSCWDNVACPSLANSNVLFFSSGFNAQITVQDNEPEEWLVNRFRREVIRSGVFRECKRRRFFENNQDKKRRMGTISKKKKKRKARQAARRNKNNNAQRSSRSKYRKQFKQQKLEKDNEPKRKEDNVSDDNWDFYEVDLPYN